MNSLLLTQTQHLNEQAEEQEQRLDRERLELEGISQNLKNSQTAELVQMAWKVYLCEREREKQHEREKESKMHYFEEHARLETQKQQ